MHSFGDLAFQIGFEKCTFQFGFEKCIVFLFLFDTLFKMDLKNALVIFVMLIRVRIRVRIMFSLEKQRNDYFSMFGDWFRFDFGFVYARSIRAHLCSDSGSNFVYAFRIPHGFDLLFSGVGFRFSSGNYVKPRSMHSFRVRTFQIGFEKCTYIGFEKCILFEVFSHTFQTGFEKRIGSFS